MAISWRTLPTEEPPGAGDLDQGAPVLGANSPGLSAQWPRTAGSGLRSQSLARRLAGRVLDQRHGCLPGHHLTRHQSADRKFARRLPSSRPGQVRGVATEPHTSQFDNAQPTGNPAAIIPMQRIRGPIFLDCGGSDSVWSSCPYANAIMSRLDQAHDPYPHLLYAYPDGGHGVGDLVPYEPDQLGPATADLWGSSPNANHNADAQIWPHLLASLAGSGGAF